MFLPTPNSSLLTLLPGVPKPPVIPTPAPMLSALNSLSPRPFSSLSSSPLAWPMTMVSLTPPHASAQQDPGISCYFKDLTLTLHSLAQPPFPVSSRGSSRVAPHLPPSAIATAVPRLDELYLCCVHLVCAHTPMGMWSLVTFGSLSWQCLTRRDTE